ncbi:unnamed protein product [Urochloa humidicola]
MAMATSTCSPRPASLRPLRAGAKPHLQLHLLPFPRLRAGCRASRLKRAAVAGEAPVEVAPPQEQGYGGADQRRAGGVDAEPSLPAWQRPVQRDDSAAGRTDNAGAAMARPGRRDRRSTRAAAAGAHTATVGENRRRNEGKGDQSQLRKERGD